MKPEDAVALGVPVDESVALHPFVVVPPVQYATGMWPAIGSIAQIVPCG